MLQHTLLKLTLILPPLARSGELQRALREKVRNSEITEHHHSRGVVCGSFAPGLAHMQSQKLLPEVVVCKLFILEGGGGEGCTTPGGERKPLGGKGTGLRQPGPHQAGRAARRQERAREPD